MMRISKVLVGGVASMFLNAALLAQQPAPTQTRDSRPAGGQVLPGQPNSVQQNKAGADSNAQSGGQSARLSTNDALAACLAIDNKEEIELAKFVQDKVSDKSVKEFAVMLAEEHQSCLEAIYKASPNASHSSSLTRDDKSNNVTRRGDQSGTLDMVQVHQEIATQCLADTKEKLGEETGQKLDKCFVGMQIAKHAAMQTKLTVFQKHATGELKNVVADGLEKTKKHLKVAENLMAQLDDSESDSSRSNKK